MLLDRTQEEVGSIGAQQLLGALDLFVEMPDRLRQQFGAGSRSLVV
jgi:hypothetical protein